MNTEVKPAENFYTVTLWSRYDTEEGSDELERVYVPNTNDNIVECISGELRKRGWFPCPQLDTNYAIEWVRGWHGVANMSIMHTGFGDWDIQAVNWMEMSLAVCIWQHHGVFDEGLWDIMNELCDSWEMKHGRGHK